MRLLFQILLAYLAAFPLVAKEPSNLPSLFQVRLVVDQPTEDSEEMTITARAGKDAVKWTVNVQKQPLMDFTAVKKAAVMKHPLSGKPMIEITLTDEGRKQFAEVTRKNRQLVIIIDGKIYHHAGEIKDGTFPIFAADFQAEAILTVKKLNAALKVRGSGSPCSYDVIIIAPANAAQVLARPAASVQHPLASEVLSSIR